MLPPHPLPISIVELVLGIPLLIALVITGKAKRKNRPRSDFKRREVRASDITVGFYFISVLLRCVGALISTGCAVTGCVLGCVTAAVSVHSMASAWVGVAWLHTALFWYELLHPKRGMTEMSNIQITLVPFILLSLLLLLGSVSLAVVSVLSSPPPSSSIACPPHRLALVDVVSAVWLVVWAGGIGAGVLRGIHRLQHKSFVQGALQVLIHSLQRTVLVSTGAIAIATAGILSASATLPPLLPSVAVSVAWCVVRVSEACLCLSVLFFSPGDWNQKRVWNKMKQREEREKNAHEVRQEVPEEHAIELE